MAVECGGGDRVLGVGGGLRGQVREHLPPSGPLPIVSLALLTHKSTVVQAHRDFSPTPAFPGVMSSP